MLWQAGNPFDSRLHAQPGRGELAKIVARVGLGRPVGTLQIVQK